MKTSNILLIGGGATALYFVLQNSKVKEELNKVIPNLPSLPSFNIDFPSIPMPSMPSFDWIADIIQMPQTAVSTIKEKVTSVTDGIGDTIDEIINAPKNLLESTKTKIGEAKDKFIEAIPTPGKAGIDVKKSAIAIGTGYGALGLLGGFGGLGFLGGFLPFTLAAGGVIYGATKLRELTKSKYGAYPETLISSKISQPFSFIKNLSNPVGMMVNNAKIASKVVSNVQSVASNVVSSGGGNRSSYSSSSGSSSVSFKGTSSLKTASMRTESESRASALWARMGN